MPANTIFQVIDFDRTLFDTSKFALLVTAELETLQPGIGKKLDEQFEAAYKDRQTFFVFREIRKMIGIDGLEALVAKAVDKVGIESLFMPGARERIAFANQIGTQTPAWGILTYGDPEDQYMKLRIAGFQDVPTILLDTPDKSKVIATWKNQNQTFTLPAEFGGGQVDIVTLEDDKLRAFDGGVEGIVGVWMQNALNDLTQGEAVAANVKPVGSLYESIEYLKTLYM